MKNIKLNMIKMLFCAFVLITVAACDNKGYDDYEAGSSPTQSLNGEWYIDVIDQETGDLLVSHALHKTYDSGQEDGSMWISDRLSATAFSGWWIEGQVNTDIDNRTFSVSNEENRADGSVFTITNGKILKDAAMSFDGNVTDSIYFEGEFDYEPGRVLIFSGHRRTGFLEDEL